MGKSEARPLGSQRHESRQSEFGTENILQRNNSNRSMSDKHFLESSRRNPCDISNGQSERMFKDSEYATKTKDSFCEVQSDMCTQLNLGSPVHKAGIVMNKMAKIRPKRPSSAGNYLPKNDYKEKKNQNLLASTIGISRKGVCLNLANMMFSKPEVGSEYNPSDKPFGRICRISSANIYHKENALVTIQKHLRGFITRNKIVKQKGLCDFLSDKNKLEIDIEDAVGEGLKLSDLSITPKSSSNKSKQQLLLEEMKEKLIFDPSDSKLESSERRVTDFTKKDKYDLSANLHIQESP